MATLRCHGSRLIVSLVTTVLLVTTVASGCAFGGRGGAGPTLRVPEAPPRVVSELAPAPAVPAEPIDDEVTADTTAEPLDEVSAPDPPSQPGRADANPTAAVDTAEPEEDPDQADELRVRRQLTSVPDQEVDRRGVEATLESTVAQLRQVDRASLDAAARAQYDTARRFLEQAESALAAGSVVFAHYLGQKALTLAQGL